jgi:hypothetical protein
VTLKDFVITFIFSHPFSDPNQFLSRSGAKISFKNVPDLGLDESNNFNSFPQDKNALKTFLLEN